MIYGKPVGKFKLTVSDPTPAWVSISFDSGDGHYPTALRLHPDELADLEHVCRIARRELTRVGEG